MINNLVKSLVLATGILLLSTTSASARIVREQAPIVSTYYRVTNQPNPLTLTCVYGDVNCRFYSSVMFENISGKDLHDTAVWTNGRVIEFTKLGGIYTKEMSIFPGIMEPGYGPSLGVRVRPDATMTPGTYVETLYIAGKLCNQIGTFLDCYYTGGDRFQVIVNITQPKRVRIVPTRRIPQPPTPISL